MSWGISEIVESDEWQICDESDKFGLNKTSPKEPDKLDWIHVDAPWSKTNNFAKCFFPMSVHFISNIIKAEPILDIGGMGAFFRASFLKKGILFACTP